MTAGTTLYYCPWCHHRYLSLTTLNEHKTQQHNYRPAGGVK
jgi:hypothetical protein